MNGEALRQEIEGKLGFFPPFFEPALSTPDVLQTLWGETLHGYLDNPIPARLKIRISTRLSRYCAIPYCLVCHSCELRALGVASPDILALLEAPFEIVRPLRLLQSQKQPLPDWPGEDSPLHEAIIAASECVYLRCPEAAAFHAEIRRTLGEEAHSRWVALLAFMEVSHRWMEAHPEIRHEGDLRPIRHFGVMLKEEPLLGDFFAHYNKRIEREQSRQTRGEAVEEIRRVLEGISRPPPNAKLKSLFRAWAKGASLLVIAVGVVCFLAARFQWALLQRWIPHGADIQANIAFAFVLGGMALWLWSRKPTGARSRIVAKISGGVVCAIGAASLFQDLSGIDLGIDQLLAQQSSNLSVATPGRMSPYSALVLIFQGLALVLLDRLYYRKSHPSEYLALLGGVLGFITALGYAYGVNAHLAAQTYNQMSLPSAVLSLLLASGIIGVRPLGKMTSTLVSATTAGCLMRRFLLLLGIAPAVIGWFGLLGRWKDWYGREFGFALVITSTTLLFCVVALILGRTLVQAELQRRKTERLLLDREFDFRATFDHAAVGVAHITMDGRWIRVNDKLCEILGYNREELLKRTFQDINMPEDMDRSVSLGWRLVKGEIPQFSIEKRYIRQDGSLIWGNLTATTLRDASGNPKYIISIIEDISERKKAEEEIARQKAMLENASRAKDQILSMVSHELRTPLTPVLAAISSCESEASSVEQRNTFEMMRRNIEHEVSLINDLLDITRISNAKLQLNLAPVDLHALIDDVFTSLRPDLMAKGIHPKLILKAERHVVQGDSARLRQILLNLLDNARKFTPPGGEVTVETSSNGTRIATRITDTGKGIAPVNLQRIFEAFEQGEQSTQRAYGGLGLGLAITKGLVDAHGGTLDVTSHGTGLGSIFTLEFSTINEPVAEPELHREAKASHVHILLVEDHNDTRLTLQRLLERRGHKVSAASSMAEAISVGSHTNFDVLISDIGLPDGSGLDVLKSLAAARGRAIPGIALSGFGAEEDIARSTEAGFMCHLAKPVNVRALEEAIAKVIS